VEHFFLYDNGSEDAYLDALHPYLSDGIVEIQEWDPHLGQVPAYEHCIEHHRLDSRWIAFIDLDEFLFSPAGSPIAELLTGFERWPAVGVNWALFSTSGHKTRPPGLVAENYVIRRDMNVNRYIKSVADPTQVVRCATGHHFLYRRGLAVDENHYPIVGPATKSVSFAQLRLNHYYTRSEEEYLVKWTTPRADTGELRVGGGPDFEAMARGEHERGRRDEAILRYAPAVREALDELERRTG
jgi:hypothetical protein